MSMVKSDVAQIKADARFEACHGDVGNMESEAQNAMVVFTRDFAGDDDAKSVAFRQAIQATSNAKKACFNLQKYDIYQVKGSMPKLGTTYKDIVNCSKALVGVMDFCKAEAGGQAMQTDVVAAFLKENWATVASQPIVSNSSTVAAPDQDVGEADDGGILV